MCESGTLDVVRVGLIGCGNVGAAFVDALQVRRPAIAAASSKRAGRSTDAVRAARRAG